VCWVDGAGVINERYCTGSWGDGQQAWDYLDAGVEVAVRLGNRYYGMTGAFTRLVVLL
jgi:hypothetical protein